MRLLRNLFFRGRNNDPARSAPHPSIVIFHKTRGIKIKQEDQNKDSRVRSR